MGKHEVPTGELVYHNKVIDYDVYLVEGRYELWDDNWGDLMYQGTFDSLEEAKTEGDKHT